MKDSYDEIFGNKQRVMLVFAHPDDAEIYCGGLLARLADDGKEVRLVKMTKGNKGSRQDVISEKDLAATREDEDRAALAVLGISEENNVNLDLGDGEVESSLTTIGLLVEQIRKFKPELVVTHNPEKILVREEDGAYYVNHRDHRATATAVVDAGYPYSRDILFFPEQIERGLESFVVTEFFFVDSWGDIDNAFIDITDQVDRKIEAIACHKSQYSYDDAVETTGYMAKLYDGRRFEQFKYLVID
jgi:LmbE family N-acetylglucosaminyl deacetylase